MGIRIIDPEMAERCAFALFTVTAAVKVRSARHHGGEGNWGDLMIPVIVANPR